MVSPKYSNKKPYPTYGDRESYIIAAVGAIDGLRPEFRRIASKYPWIDED